MGPNYHLITNNVFSIISAVIMTGTALFTYLNDRKNVANITIALAVMMAVVFYISHVIGISVSDPLLSRNILMFNLCIFAAGAFQLHAITALIGNDKKYKPLIVGTYAAAIAFTIFFLIFPDLFLHPSVPKMYFPNYYNPGILNWTRIAFLHTFVLIFTFVQLALAQIRAETPTKRKQYLYFMVALMGIYAVIYIPNLLVYNFNVDPLWGAFAGIFWAIPVVYGAVRYGLFNVRIIAKQAFIYALAVAGVGALIALFNYSNVWIMEALPGFPLWTTALISSVLVVTLSVVIWRQLRQSDILKYEFITTATHKFRTPLTHIKWATENLEKTAPNPEQSEQLSYIEEANAKLVELTNVLMNISESENTEYEYRMTRTDLSLVVQEALTALAYQAKAKKVELSVEAFPAMNAVCDASRIRFIIQTFIENAVHYTPEHGKIWISLRPDEKHQNIFFSVKDSGIGIAKEELPLLFSKFYRGAQARLADTEGMGIGLYVAKEIITRHQGRIWAESEGQGKGSTFSFSLQMAS